ncbi:MAG: UDP-3-O-acyl-N-acetylglucosamine deacetylase [Bdellovibrionaceae bacterium]|nr:UDP-3-O-acyl-N-acetylglucosamine deacetylase [Pseudobdellovibrionaceae bacterium]
MFLQRTIRKRVAIEGMGLHTGKPTQLSFVPAPDNTGIYFVRTDLPGRPAIAARAEFVQATSYATTLGGDEFSVSTVEHCLSALAALRIDNLFIELNGPEIPIGDGSAKIFLEALLAAGMTEQNAPRKYAYIDQNIYYGDDEKYAYVVPYNGLRVTCTIEFSHPQIGHQTLDIDINEHSFSREISRARTFGFLKDVEALRQRGLAKGGSLDNAIVLDSEEILNPDGLRYPNEFVRHKILDALGDLVTLGMPMMGHLILYKAGHDVLNRLVRKIIESPESYRHIELGSNLPEKDLDGSYLWAFS